MNSGKELEGGRRKEGETEGASGIARPSGRGSPVPLVGGLDIAGQNTACVQVESDVILALGVGQEGALMKVQHRTSPGFTSIGHLSEAAIRTTRQHCFIGVPFDQGPDMLIPDGRLGQRVCVM